MSFYKQPVRIFDAFIGRSIAKLPKNLYQPLAVLCLIFHPVGWMILAILGSGVALYLDYSYGWILSVAVVISLLQADVLKLVFRRPRPESIYVDNMRMRSFSFPSAHAYAAATGGGYVCAYLAAFVPAGALAALFVALAVIAVVIAIARVYLKAHFPSDVAGGLILGTLALVISMAVAGAL